MGPDRKTVILHYAGIAARGLREPDADKLREIENEKMEIEQGLGLTPKEILAEAAKLVVRT
jgi:hypothetical protein